ncbi:MAG: Uma2 family endonuclease [Bdellovibrio bacteriovorus]
MSTKSIKHLGRGPFRPEQLRPGDPYELSNGHPVECLPSGGRSSRASLLGGLALATDPAVDSAGVDTGYAADDYTLRAPDLAVGNVPDAPGWVKGAPPLAVEYADTGQDESDLPVKIRQLLAAGTRLVWVVRLIGPRRVDVHRADAPTGSAPEVRVPGELLEAPGILSNPLPVEALFDPGAAQEVALRNLLQRHGYAGLDAVRAEGAEEGRAEGKAEGKIEGEIEALRLAILQVLESRGLSIDAELHPVIAATTDRDLLTHWLRRAAVCVDSHSLLDPS